MQDKSASKEKSKTPGRVLPQLASVTYLDAVIDFFALLKMFISF